MSQPKLVLILLLALVLGGCAGRKYRPVPLSPAATATSLENRSLNSPEVRRYIERVIGPPHVSGSWDLRDLTLAAFYYNPALQIARARVSEAEAAVVTAGARPNPSIRGDLGGETAPESPWIAGFGFSLPIETAGKRGHRITAGERLADVARWNLATTAWAVRAQVRSAFVEYFAAKQNLTLLNSEENLRIDQVRLLQQRFAVGMIPQPEVDAARIFETQTQLAIQAADGRVSQAVNMLAAAIGVPANSLQGVKIIWPIFEHPPDAASLNLATIKQDAVLNRLDIRRALADYSSSEAALQVEIANQYPNLDLGPDYAFEEGTHLFSVAAGLVLPVFNRNQGPIREALARRNEMAAQFLSTQLAGIAASEQALTTYTASLNELGKAAQLIQQSEAQEQAIGKSLQAGQSDRVALNGAQLQTAVTKVAQNDALYRAQQALGDLENAVQRPLLPGDIQPLSPQTPALQQAKGSHL